MKLKEEITAEICAFYADEFSVFTGGTIGLEIAPFKKMLEREIERREEANLPAPSPADGSADGGASCVLC